MDFYTLAAAKATVFIMENKLINDTRKALSPYLEVDSVKFAANLTVMVVSEIADHYTEGAFKGLLGNDALEVIAENTIELGDELTRPKDQVIVDVICRWLDEDPAIEELFELVEEQDRADAAIREDAEKAAAALEELTTEIEQEISEEPAVSEQEINALMNEFEEERKSLEGKLDRMADKYFENHPELDDKQIANAEERFKEIKDEQVQVLEVDQAERLSERMDLQDERREYFAEKRQEVEGTREQESRDERS